jgi:hypothetical protein
MIIKNISDSKTDLMHDAEYFDQLDFDGDSVDSNKYTGSR